MMAAAGCSSSSGSGTSTAAQSSASAVAAASAAATAKPGEYGSPVNPSLPNPTDVATDAPATTKAGASGAGTSRSESSVDVVVTYSGWDDTLAGVEVGAYAAGIAESGGTCTLTLTSGADSATASAQAEPDAASTSCPGLVVPGSELSSGSWTAVVSYESRGTHGQSDPVEVVVP
jgi:hypothetical protein